MKKAAKINTFKVSDFAAQVKTVGGDFPEHTHTEGGYDHLPLERKKYYLSKITGFKQISVCEDVATHYAYWKNNVNHNPDDCCNLTLKK